VHELRIYSLPEDRELLLGVFKDEQGNKDRRSVRPFRIIIPDGFRKWGRLNQRTAAALRAGGGPIYIDLG
jgi:hypothetical protein